jgi:uncharacterized protein YjbI with pentapeptide repeats
MDAQEILKRYAAGQRDFSRVSLIQVCLTNANLIGVHLIGAHLIGADLRGTDLTDVVRRNANEGNEFGGSVYSDRLGFDQTTALCP